MKYYEISETQARQARNMWSLTEYVNGSTTEEYRQEVDEAYSLVDQVPEHAKEKALYYADMYARKLAEWLNKGFRIELMCPSVMISGPSNFPVSRKEKQNAARGRHFGEYDHIKGYLSKIECLSNTTHFCKHFKAVQNHEINRLQLFFESKPDESVREMLKKNGFRWAPSQSAWQRQLTGNAQQSMLKIMRELDASEKEVDS